MSKAEDKGGSKATKKTAQKSIREKRAAKKGKNAAK